MNLRIKRSGWIVAGTAIIVFLTGVEATQPGEPEGVDGPPEWLAEMPPLPPVAPIRLSPALDLRDLTRDAYAGLISQAKAGLAELLGPMTAEQAARYDASWQPMFGFPAPECIAYLEQVIPVIEDALRLRPALAEELAEIQVLWESAAYAEPHDPAAARLLIELALPGMGRVKAMEAAFSELLERLESLGDPPDPGALQAAAAQRHRRAMRSLEGLLLGQASLDGYYERLQEVELAPTGLEDPRFFKVTHATKGLLTRAIAPLGGSPSGLVIFSQYTRSESEPGENVLGLELDLDFDFDPWSAFFAEPTEDGWASYSYDPEDDWLDVTFYRPGSDRLIIDDYTIAEGKVEGLRSVYHRAPLEAAPRVYGDQIDPADPGAFLRANRDGVLEGEQAFRQGKAAYQDFLRGGGVLPPLPEADEVYWVLKDVAIEVRRHSRTREKAYAAEGYASVFREVEQFEPGPNHLSATWRTVHLDWENPPVSSGGAERMWDPAREFVNDPDQEEVMPVLRMIPIEEVEVHSASVQWGMPPAVMLDGANWLVDPRIEGDDTAFAPYISKLMLETAEGFALSDHIYARPLPGMPRRGILVSRIPFHADEEPAEDEETAASQPLLSGGAGARDLVVSLRSLRLSEPQCVVPMVVTTPGAAVIINYLYEQRAMTPGEALAAARAAEGGLVAATFADVQRATGEVAEATRANVEAQRQAAGLKREREAMHMANIAYSRMEEAQLREEIGTLEMELRSGGATEATVERLNQLKFRLITTRSAIINEGDRIEELETGQLVSSRTPFDDFCRAQVIEKARESARELSAGMRARRKSEYLMGKLSPEQRRIAQGIVNKLVSEGKGLYAQDYEELNSAMQNIFQGEQEYEQARIDEEVAWENAWVEGAEYVKTGAEIGMAVTSMGGGPLYISALYQAGAGYIDKGPMEGLKRAVTTYSDAADILISGYDGWKSGGAWGAVEGASVSLLMNKGPEVALGRLSMRLKRGSGFDGGFGRIEVTTRVPGGKAPDLDAGVTPISRRGREAIEAGRWQQEMEWGEQLAKDAFSDYTRLRTAEIRGNMDAAELSALRMQVRRKMCSVGNSMTAKSYLKYKAPARMGQAYTEIYSDVLDDAVTAYRMGMREAGFNDQKIVQIRNASSLDAGMDADLALVEQLEIKRVVGPDGKVAIERTPMITRDGQRVSLAEYQQEGSRVMAEAYRKVTGGYSAHGSFVDMTTSVHLEAYRDPTWLSLPKAGPHSDVPGVNRRIDQILGRVDPNLTPQALGVTPAKAEIMFREHPELSPLGSMMENCRGTAKDLDTKFIPLVDSKIRQLEGLAPGDAGPSVQRKLAELRETHAYLQACQRSFAEIGKGQTHPGRWMEDFRLTTGGEDPIAVTRRLAKMAEAASRM
jgi:hypothetical protein